MDLALSCFVRRTNNKYSKYAIVRVILYVAEFYIVRDTFLMRSYIYANTHKVRTYYTLVFIWTVASYTYYIIYI